MGSDSDSKATPQERVPRHVAVIMDGNGRWARRKGLPRHRGHAEGAESVRAVVRECARLGVQELTLYAFSTENWRRPKTEVHFLMELLRTFLAAEMPEIMENRIRLRAIGRLAELPARVRRDLERAIATSSVNGGMILRLALNYGGRQEILDAAKRIAEAAVRGEIAPQDVTEEALRGCLYDGQMRDPDLLIRTGGEMRISNFLLWEVSYAELWFTPICWPDFREAELRTAFNDYAGRERRFGGLGGEPLSAHGGRRNAGA